MTQKSLNLSKKIDPAILSNKYIIIFDLINQVANDLNVSYVIVGATARDLVLHYGFNTEIRRATMDIDFGIQVDSWKGFEKLKAVLLNN